MKFWEEEGKDGDLLIIEIDAVVLMVLPVIQCAGGMIDESEVGVGDEAGCQKQEASVSQQLRMPYRRPSLPTFPVSRR